MDQQLQTQRFVGACLCWVPWGLDRSTSTEHLLDEFTVEELAILISNSSSLFPFSLGQLITHCGQGFVKLISIDLSSSTGIEH